MPKQSEVFDTIWEVDDGLRKVVEPILPGTYPHASGIGERFEQSSLVPEGGPLAAITAPANRPDAACLEDLLYAVVAERPEVAERLLCWTKATTTPRAERPSKRSATRSTSDPFARKAASARAGVAKRGAGLSSERSHGHTL